jgi:hypothetical protein
MLKNHHNFNYLTTFGAIFYSMEKSFGKEDENHIFKVKILQIFTPQKTTLLMGITRK